jgi:hypothetical protein
MIVVQAGDKGEPLSILAFLGGLLLLTTLLGAIKVAFSQNMA